MARAQRLTPALLTGATDVAQQAGIHGPKFARFCEPAGRQRRRGFVTRSRRGVVVVAGMTVVNERIVETDLILDSKFSGLKIGE